MRATTANPPIEKARRRLLESCAIAAGLIALAHGGPALAQVSGSAVYVDVGAGTDVTNDGVANSTTVTVTQAQSIINWVPDDNAATGAPIDFLAAGETWNFVGTGDYTVLNRFVNGSGGSLSRQVALSGTVNSYVGSTSGPQGGNIWFYNAGGVLIGNGAAINVGSLLLTANDIDTTGGLFGAGGEIRFRGAAGTSAVEIANGAAINAAMAGNPGGSYVALVAPRIVQSGAVRVDGSAAYVAAEQADIRINNGLFDINVLVGAAGGNAIVHDGTTTGPSHEQGDIDQSRIFMVAIPKNDAVTMLVSGEVGYDDAVVAQVDPDGAVVLSAGYNIVGGQIAPEPANGIAADIAVGDTIFHSSVTAHASGAFGAAPELGLLSVEGDASFIGDARTTLDIGAGQQMDVAGSLTLASGGVAETPGAVAVHVAGGQLALGGDLTLTAPGPLRADGSSVGGDVELTVTDGGTVQAVNVDLQSTGSGDIGGTGDGGDGTGGAVTLLVSGPVSSLSSDTVTLQSVGTGGGLVFSNGLAVGASDIGGNGTGGDVALTVENGATLNAGSGVSAGSTGIGQTGAVQSGSGTGGSAVLSVADAASTFLAAATSVSADGFGGGDYAQPSPPDILTAAGGAGQGGTASVLLSGDAESFVALGSAIVSASGQGGYASAGENSAGGAARGGTAAMTLDGELTVVADNLTLLATGGSGGAASTSLLTARSGDAQGGAATLAAGNGATFSTDGGIDLAVDGTAALSEAVGSGTGGDIVVSAASGATIQAQAGLSATAYGGSNGPDIAVDTGSGTGGTIALIADGGTLSASYYSLFTDGTTVDAQGSGGIAVGGTVDLLASNGGLIEAFDTLNFSDFGANGWSGASDAGAAATGGAVRFTADGGTISLPGFVSVSVDGVSGGRVGAGGTAPTGRGGTLLLRTVAEPSNGSTIALGSFFGHADGSSYVSSEGPSDLPTTGNGVGGTAMVDIEGGSLSASGTVAIGANGYGGGVAPDSGVGTGGVTSVTQTGGALVVTDFSVSADGFGGFDPATPGDAFGGTATMELRGGTASANSLTVSASGHGFDGFEGDNFDPLAIIAASNGGNATGGTATITIDGSATIDTGALTALATGTGGYGGNFYDYSGVSGAGGDAGDGTGGTATVNMLAGTLTTTSLLVDASGSGGQGGSVFESSSSGSITGLGVGGQGGNGQGGLSTLQLAAGIDPAAAVTVAARGVGGNGGDGTTGGGAGSAIGGTAEVVVTDFNAGVLSATIDASAIGGTGGYSDDDDGGDGGDAEGGTARVVADGAGASVAVTNANFIAEGRGGSGGAAHSYAASAQPNGPAGGDGGDGAGGTFELVATAGGTLMLAPDPNAPGAVALAIAGTGGDGGTGADNDFAAGLAGGAGGNGGAARGGTLHLLANGGTIGTDGVPVDISVGGVAGAAGTGGIGSAGSGSDGTTGTTSGGRAIIEATGAAALVDLGDTNIAAVGDAAGRIAFLGDGTIAMTSLTAQALGAAAATNNDTDLADTGIFFGLYGGTVQTAGAASLATDGSVGVYGEGAGTLAVGGDLDIQAADQIDIRHDLRQGTAPTIGAGGDITMVAGTSISGAAGSEIAATGALALTATAGTIDVDRLAGDTITLTSAGTTHVEHAEATQGLIGRASSFSTGLNSIITGGNIDINAPGAVELGNSSAGGFVFVVGQTISFNAIDAGTTVALNANGAGAADGIDGGDISAAGDVVLSGNHVAISGTIATPASLAISTGSGGATTMLADVGGNVSVITAGDIAGVYRAGGNVILNADGNIAAEADAAGGYADPNGIVAEGYVFADADGDAALVDSSAATMLAVRAGGAASIDGGQAGEDIFVLAGTTADLANLVAGDDISVTSTGAMTIVNAATTGTGGDDRSVVYAPGASLPDPFLQIQATPADLSNIVLSAPAATIAAADLSAFANLTGTAGGAVTATGLLQSGLATDISGASLSFAAVSAGTDLDLTATTGGIASTGALAAGQDATIDAATAIDIAEVDAGDDIAITAGGAIAIGAAYSDASGLDDEGDGSNIVIGGGATTVDHAEATDNFTADVASFATGPDTIITDGDIDITAAGDIVGVYVAGGNITLDAGGNIAAEADAAGGYVDRGGELSEGYVFADADGDAALVDSSAATMLAVRAGGAASIDGGQAGEDIFVLAGTTADLANLVAGDDISVTSTGAMTIVNAATTGTGGDDRSVVYAPGASLPDPFLQIQASPADLSNIVLSAPAATIAATDLSAFANLTATAGGAVTATGLLQSGLATDISGASLSFAAVSAGTDLDLTATSGGIASTGTLAAGQNVALDAATGIAADGVASQGTTSLASANGAVAVGTLASGGPVSASGNSIAIGGSGDLDFASLVAATGDAVVGTDGTLSLADGDVAGLADLSGDQGLVVAALTAGRAQLGSANGDIALIDASAAGALAADAAGSIAVDGTVTGTSIALASHDIAIGAAGQLGTAGTTASLSLSNNSDLQTFIGGDGSGNGYNIDAAEMARLYGTQIRIVAPVATSVAGGTAGGRPIPDAVIGDFTMTGGTPTSNLGANGALTIETAGRAQVSGAVALTGLSDANGLVLLAGEALEVVLGEGTIRLSGATADVPGGRLSMRADQILVATRAAMNDIDNAASTDDIGVRLAENDGITSDEGALFARGIDASVTEGFYVQNSGAGTDFVQRRGLSFGAGGLNVNTAGPATRIVLNGVQLGPQGQITGLDTIALLTVNGAAPTSAGLDARSTLNGCLILNPAVCGMPPPRYEAQFPVQDVIEEVVDPDGESGDGLTLPTALIMMRDIDPMSGAPLLDDPVTGAGNDDLWSAPEGGPAGE